MEQSYFETLKSDEIKTVAFLNKQKSAATVTLMGPTSSAKSTLITELLEPLSNKLLGYNVGDTAQTTLLRTCLMLNSRFKSHEVIVQCVSHTDNDAIMLKFLFKLKKILATAFYECRDDLDEFQVSEQNIKDILNPADRCYHVFEFVKQQGLIENFSHLLNTISSHIISTPLSFEEEANKKYKERRKEQSTIKKNEIFDEVFDRRFSDNTAYRDALKKWFIELQNRIHADLSHLWTTSNSGKYILCDGIEDKGRIHELMEKLYSEHSACSLIFEEVDYVTSPSEKFVKKFEIKGLNSSGRKLKLNILDTVGLTQSSQEKDDISDAMDNILQRETDGILFLCASDEQPLVYETCITLLTEKRQKIQYKPIVICRTKADIVIKNILRNKWRKDTGINSISDSKYPEYLKNAFEVFQNEYIFKNANHEDELCKGLPVEFLSMASDDTEKMNPYLNNELHSSKVFDVLLNMTDEIDKQYSNNGQRPWLYSNDINSLPLSLVCKADSLNNTIGVALAAYNERQKKQYTQYIESKATFHWRSVDCFIRNLSNGEGHETKAYSYGNFKIYMKNMVARWLRELIPMEDMISDFTISYEHLDGDPKIVEEVKATFSNQFCNLVSNYWWIIIDNVAKKLTYTCLQPTINKKLYDYTWDGAFRTILKFIDQQFSSDNYWQSNLLPLIEEEFNNLLQKMYIYDEV